jgi:hypothetical protein
MHAVAWVAVMKDDLPAAVAAGHAVAEQLVALGRIQGHENAALHSCRTLSSPHWLAGEVLLGGAGARLGRVTFDGWLAAGAR